MKQDPPSEADEDAVPDGFAEAVAAIRYARLDSEPRLDFNTTRNADDPNAPPDEDDRGVPLVVAGTGATAAGVGTAVATVPAVAEAPIVASQPTIRWSVVAAATILIAAPIAGYSFLMSDSVTEDTAAISPVLEGATQGLSLIHISEPTRPY